MLCCESIPALQLGILASELYRRSHVFDATLLVVAPHGRVGTPLATPLERGHLLAHHGFFLLRPQGVPYMASTGSRVCWPSIIMLRVTPVLACGVAR